MSPLRQAIGVEVEAIGLELLALRKRMRAAGSKFHRQGMVNGRHVIEDSEAWTAYLALFAASPALYSRGHSLKRLGRAIQKRSNGRAEG